MGNYNENVENKEKCRFTEIEVDKSFVITLDEWKKMIENRTEHHFKNSFYKDVILEKLRTLYSGCVPCISNHYLRKKSAVLKLRRSDVKFYEGYVNVYCSHVHCCYCAVTGNIDLFTFVDRVEGNVNLSGKRSHFIECVKSRHITGKQRELIAEKLHFMKPHSLYRSMQSSLMDEERILGAHTYAPSQSVLHNIKSEGRLSHRYSENWTLNLEIMAKEYARNNRTFLRNFSVHPPSVALYNDAQILAYKDLCKKDILYFDATGSIIKKCENGNEFQIYTLLFRNPYAGGPALPVAMNIMSSHDAGSIRRFLEIFIHDVVKMCGCDNRPKLIMIDGSFAMWNAILLAFNCESRLDYYIRCWRVVTGKATKSDLQSQSSSLVHNCLIHAMRAAKIFVNKYYLKRHRIVAMYWISLLFFPQHCERLIALWKALSLLPIVKNLSH